MQEEGSSWITVTLELMHEAKANTVQMFPFIKRTDCDFVPTCFSVYQFCNSPYCCNMELPCLDRLYTYVNF